MLAGGIFIHRFAIDQCDFYQVVPSVMGLEEYVLEVLLNVLFVEAIESAYFGEQVEPFMLVF